MRKPKTVNPTKHKKTASILNLKTVVSDPTSERSADKILIYYLSQVKKIFNFLIIL